MSKTKVSGKSDLAGVENKALWGGRFEESLDPRVFRFNQSIQVDARLWLADLKGTLAHARELARLKILGLEDFQKLQVCLEEWIKDASQGKKHPIFASERFHGFEDVHSLLETALVEAVGDVGKRVHTGRSRNDQVATAFRLSLMDELERVSHYINGTIRVLLGLTEKNGNHILPGYTHLQRGQPILLGHWALAYVEMLFRDLERFEALAPRLKQLPLGAAALAGSPYAINRESVANELGFTGICRNSLDAVSDRDFCIEIASACSIGMMHLSRLSEDLILYCSREFGFFGMSDRVSTGSSLMPQKKNPDVPELIRGKSGPVFGQLQSLLVTCKGLPLAYNKDLQEDKAATFGALDTFVQCLEVMSVFLTNIDVNPERMRGAASEGFLNATDLADYLVRKGVAFRDSHDAAGKLVRLAMSKGGELTDLSIEQFRTVCPEIEGDIYEALSLESCIGKKKTLGSTHPQLVNEAYHAARVRLESGGGQNKF